MINGIARRSVTFFVGRSIQGVRATTGPQRDVTPDVTIYVWGVAAGDFETRMTSYATLRDQLQQGLPPLRITDDPRDIRRAEHVLARRIRAARSGANGAETPMPPAYRFGLKAVVSI